MCFPCSAACLQGCPPLLDMLFAHIGKVLTYLLRVSGDISVEVCVWTYIETICICLYTYIEYIYIYSEFCKERNTTQMRKLPPGVLPSHRNVLPAFKTISQMPLSACRQLYASSLSRSVFLTLSGGEISLPAHPLATPMLQMGCKKTWD